MADRVAALSTHQVYVYLLSHLQALDQVRVRPADLLREASEHAEAAAGGHLDHLKGVGHNHTLLLVVGGRDALEALHTWKVKRAERSRNAKRSEGTAVAVSGRGRWYSRAHGGKTP